MEQNEQNERKQFRKTIVIGDIHGCYNTFRKLLRTMGYDEWLDRLIVLGDYVDRGKYSKEVLGYLIALQDKVGEESCVCLIGNHEEMILEYADGQKKWLFDKDCYAQLSKNDELNKYLEWFRSLPVYFEEEKYVCVHGGMVNAVYESNTRDSMLWTYINDYIYLGKKILICGHTPMQYVYMNNKVVGVDTGCVFGKQLSGVIINSDFTSMITCGEIIDERDVVVKKNVAQ